MSMPPAAPQDRVRVAIKRLPHGADLPLPAYQTELAAGADLLAACSREAPVRLEPGAFALVETGIALALPAGLEAQVRPRSGLAVRHGITVLNAPGTIDADYRGEIKVLLINHGARPFEIRRGQRIAQLVLSPVLQARFEPVLELTGTQRGSGGFGSTGS